MLQGGSIGLITPQDTKVAYIFLSSADVLKVPIRTHLAACYLLSSLRINYLDVFYQRCTSPLAHHALLDIPKQHLPSILRVPAQQDPHPWTEHNALYRHPNYSQYQHMYAWHNAASVSSSHVHQRQCHIFHHLASMALVLLDMQLPVA